MAVRLLALHVSAQDHSWHQTLCSRAALAQVLHVDGHGNAKTLYVWDGSDARPFPYRSVATWLITPDINLVPSLHAAEMTDTMRASCWMLGLCFCDALLERATSYQRQTEVWPIV